MSGHGILGMTQLQKALIEVFGIAYWFFFMKLVNHSQQCRAMAFCTSQLPVCIRGYYIALYGLFLEEMGEQLTFGFSCAIKHEALGRSGPTQPRSGKGIYQPFCCSLLIGNSYMKIGGTVNEMVEWVGFTLRISPFGTIKRHMIIEVFGTRELPRPCNFGQLMFDTA